MKKMTKLAILFLAMLMIVLPFTACSDDEPTDTGDETKDTSSDTQGGIPDNKEEDESYITDVRRINGTDIEVVFSKKYNGGNPRALKFKATSESGDKLSYNMDYGYGGAIYFDHMLTLELLEPVEGDAKVNLEYEGVKYEVPYEPYYQYSYVSEVGIPIYGSRTLIKGEDTLKRAGEIIDDMLSSCTEVTQQLIASGAKLVIFGKGEHAYYIPEHRGGYDESMLYVEGFGGYTSSITESNVWHWRSDNAEDPTYTTGYINECILVHEFAHGVKIAGIDAMADQSLANEFQMVYRHAVAAGLWPNSYAISNSDEFFATLSAIWFNVMNESGGNDKWDGVRGPINTRDELYNYDPVSYNFFAKLYDYVDLDGEWKPVPNTVTISGLGKEKAPDYGDEKHDFAYPNAIGFLGIDESATYKFFYSEADYILDVSATSAGVGLWWDFMADHPDSAGSMTYNFEIVGKPTTKDHITSYTVRIKNVRDGYLYVNDDDHIRADKDGNVGATEFVLAVDETGLATIGYDGKVLYVTGDPDNGTETILSAEGKSKFHVMDVSEQNGKVLFIHNGKANGDEKGAVAVSGDKIELTAEATLDGKTFVKWVASSGKLSDETSLTTEFTMPDGDVVIWAEYK